MFTIQIKTPVPDLKEMRLDFSKQLINIQSDIPDYREYLNTLSDLKIPNLFSLPTPLFSGYSNIMQELVEVIDAIKYQADTLTMMNIFQPIASVIGGSLRDMLPKIPVLDISLLDIVGGNIKGMYDAVKSALSKGLSLPFLPTNIFENYSNLEKEALVALKMILVGYKEALLNTMQSMVSSAMSILKISGVLPVLPTVPTIDQLKALALLAFPEYDSWYSLISKVEVPEIIAVLGFSTLVIPDLGFRPNYSNYEQYLMESLNQIKDGLISQGLKMMVDFVENTLGVIGFSFPTITIRF